MEKLKYAPSIYATEELRLWRKLNERDETLALTKYLGRTWTHKIEGYTNISIVGLRVLSRILHAKAETITVVETAKECHAIARAHYKCSMLGAYSVDNSIQLNNLIAEEMAKRNALLKVIPQHIVAAFTNNRRVYFAHPKSMYGTARERYYKKVLREGAKGWAIIDPSKVIDPADPESRAMENCFGCIRNCDAVAIACIGNYISKGVWEEIEFALQQEKTVVAITEDGFIKIQDQRFFTQTDGTDWQRYVRVDFN